MTLYIHTAHCGILHLDHTGSSTTAFPEGNPPPPPIPSVWRHTRQSCEKMKVQLQCTSRHSLTAEMRLEALKAHVSEALPRSRLPGNCCYATAESPNQSAACCSLRLNCTTMFHILVRSAVYTRAVDAREKKAGKCMLMLLLCRPQASVWKNKKNKKTTWISQTDASHRDSFTEYVVNFECDAWPQRCMNAVH